jgi:hypothetical protein
MLKSDLDLDWGGGMKAPLAIRILAGPVAPLAAERSQAGRVYRIGVLSPSRGRVWPQGA